MRSALVLACLVMATPARADDVAALDPAAALATALPSPSEDPARASMKRYFAGEMLGGYTLMAMGVAGVASGTGLYLAGDDREGLRGASYPLLGFGVVHLAAGIFVNVGSAKRVRVFGKEITEGSDGWIEREEKRMRGVSTQFLVLKVIEGVGIAGGITMAAFAAQHDRPQLAGIGLTLAVELAATLVFDIVAARRASRYRRELAGIAF